MIAPVIETPRLTLRRFVPADAGFILELVNDPDWLRYIGDKNIRTVADAAKYLENGPMAMYARHGFGLLLVTRKGVDLPVGMCGLIRREGLDDVDLGFALLPRYRGMGYAREAADATLRWGREALGLARIVAITTPANAPSARLLEKLGFVLERTMAWGGNAADPVRLYARETPRAPAPDPATAR